MKTEIVNADERSISKAVSLLGLGEVVALPTETVYGLAGDATNPSAIKKIFDAKGRPQDNPLIVHISNLDMLFKVAKTVSVDALKLAKAFWPGPLTIVVPKSDYVCKETCAGLDSVGVRMPSNEIARKVIDKFGKPFAAPSANLSGKPSPTDAETVFEDMNGKIPLIIDGGTCDAGVESTVVSVLNDTPIVLRPGVITAEDMQRVLDKPVEIAKAITQEVKSNEKVLSPGMKYKHYAPKANVTILSGTLESFVKFVKKNRRDGVFVLCFDGEEKLFDVPAVPYGAVDDEKAQAHNLFSALRQLDKLGAKEVFARCPKNSGISLAVYNRLIRSAGFKIIEI